MVGLGRERSAVDFSKLGLRPALKENFESNIYGLDLDVGFLMRNARVAMMIAAQREKQR